MMLLDWPLFFAIREREVERFLDQPLTKVVFEPQGVTLVPIESQHTESYFLTKIASMARSEEHTSELQSLMRLTYAVSCLKKNTTTVYTLCPLLISKQKEL